MNIHINKISKDKILISTVEFNQIVEKLKKSESVEIEEIENDLDIYSLMKIQESNNSLKFLHEEGEDVYTVNDVKEKYK